MKKFKAFCIGILSLVLINLVSYDDFDLTINLLSGVFVACAIWFYLEDKK